MVKIRRLCLLWLVGRVKLNRVVVTGKVDRSVLVPLSMGRVYDLVIVTLRLVFRVFLP